MMQRAIGRMLSNSHPRAGAGRRGCSPCARPQPRTEQLSCGAKWHDQFPQKRVVFVRLPARERELLEDFGRFSERLQCVLHSRYIEVQQISVLAQRITTGAGASKYSPD